MPNAAKLYNINLLSKENIQKFVLPYYNLENSQVSEIKFKNTDKQRAVYKIYNNGKEYCLKKVYFDENELLFVYSAIEWIYRNNINTPRILPNKYRGRFTQYENMLFILTPWIEGIKCDYDNKQHLISSCTNLAKMHKSCFEFFPINGSYLREGYNNLFESLNKRFGKLLLNSNTAFKYQDYFSKIFLNSFDKGIYLAKKSLEALTTVDFNKLDSSLCHMDYVNKNLIFDNNSNIWVIDFDKCRMDYCVHDLAYFLRRLLRRTKTNWDIKTALICLKSYEKIKPLNIHEYKYLLGYLSFPQRYWKISRDYYRNIKKCNKKAFVNLLNKSTKNFHNQITFVENFSKFIDIKFMNI